MNPLIQNGSRENNFKLVSRRLKVEAFDVFVRGSPIFTQNEFKFSEELDFRWVIYQYPKTINTFKDKFVV